MQVSCTAGATSEIAGRVAKVLDGSRDKSDRLGRLKSVQIRIDGLKNRGLLKRQEYSAARSSDFKKMFLKQD